ncbi:class II glutamine amidotransferase [candidate division WOR-3 bacterium]|nr:class II glutamine amidotransferase [candidate division WOR-3 bacterium]
MNVQITTARCIPLAGALIVLGILLDAPLPASFSAHNCRFWGIVYAVKDQSIQNAINSHLDSLRSLGAHHTDGWGIAYYVTLDSGDGLPVIERGEPGAPLDPRYACAAGHVADHANSAAIAHVRSGSSGPCSGIPDPHPFSRYAVYRAFHMFFAHNGTLDSQVLLDLIAAIDPLYLSLNPPDYAPDHLDSDLYAILVTEIIDMNTSQPIEECIRIAITKIDSAVAAGSVQCNFVMIDGSTLYAVNFSRSPIDALTLYFYAPSGRIDFWAAASEPLDNQPFCWTEVPNSTLVILTPNSYPRFLDVLIADPAIETAGFNIVYPNPTTAPVTISFTLPERSRTDPACRIRIYNCAGQLVKTMTPNAAERSSQNSVVWHGSDEKGNQLPSGVYYCCLCSGDTSFSKKLVYIR